MNYVKKNLNLTNVIIDQVSEIISFNINIDSVSIKILACYRPPYVDNEMNFFNSVEKILNNSNTTESIIVCDLKL